MRMPVETRRANDHALFIVFFANGGPQHFDLSQEHLTFARHLADALYLSRWRARTGRLALEE